MQNKFDTVPIPVGPCVRHRSFESAKDRNARNPFLEVPFKFIMAMCRAMPLIYANGPWRSFGQSNLQRLLL